MSDIIYCDFDKFVCAWTRNLIKSGEIPDGEVWEKPIEEISPESLSGVRQFHAFNGIAGWSLALRLAGWSPEVPVWTGSCPCQPYSTAGKGKGEDDARDLWPAFFQLVKACRPPVIFGEQVASSDVIGKVSGKARTDGRRVWLDRIQTDLEKEGYSFGACVMGAHSVSAPHIRQRLYWFAYRPEDDRLGYLSGKRSSGGSQDGPGQPAEMSGERRQGVNGLGDNGGQQDNAKRGSSEPRRESLGRNAEAASKWQASDNGSNRSSQNGNGLAQDPASVGRRGRRDGDQAGDDWQVQAAGLRADGGVGNNGSAGLEDGGQGRSEQEWLTVSSGTSWSDYEIIPCSDGTQRRTGTGIFPLAPRLPRSLDVPYPELRAMAEVAELDARSLSIAKRTRNGALKGSGNSIVPELAAIFIKVCMEEICA